MRSMPNVRPCSLSHLFSCPSFKFENCLQREELNQILKEHSGKA